MYEYILKNKHKTYAFDPKKGNVSFENTKNINEIIKTYNNLEELDNIYKLVENKYEDEIAQIQTNYKSLLINFIICAIVGMIFGLPFSYVIGVSVIPIIRFSITKTNELKMKKRYTKKLTMLSDYINQENEKLNNLKETDEQVIVECEQPKVELKKNEDIAFLNSKLRLIDLVSIRRKELKKLYKENLLDEILNNTLSEKEIEYVKFLISNKKIKKENNKVKQLKK